MRAYLVKLHGRVQKVGLRRHVQELAQELSLAGYVRNERDGSVSIFVQGDEKKVEKFIQALNNPPPPALVRKLEQKEVKPRPKLKFFEIRYSKPADELQEGFGAMHTVFMDYWKEFREYRTEFRTEFRDFRNEFSDFRNEFRDYRKEFSDFRNEFRNEFSDFRNEFRDYRNEFRSEFSGFREEFRDYRNEFRTEFSGFREEFRDYRSEFREFVKRMDEFSERVTRVLELLVEESKRNRDILEILVRDSRETREMLNESLKMLREVASRVL
ncbi:MAG: acylphosphatase [Candidatus Caldarchaeum sp.]|nr:acylphosphatase [Candidatus Caldarchaeum sp.]